MLSILANELCLERCESAYFEYILADLEKYCEIRVVAKKVGFNIAENEPS